MQTQATTHTYLRLTVPTPEGTRLRGLVRRSRDLAFHGFVVVVVSLAFGPLSMSTARTLRHGAAEMSGAPPGLPGPPPGAASGLPTLSGSGPPAIAGALPGPATIPSRLLGPSLLSGLVHLDGQQLTLAIACRAGGRVSLYVAALRPGALARGTYACRHERGYARLGLRRADARRLGGLGRTLAIATVSEAGRAATLSVSLQARGPGPGDWSDGGLVCDELGEYEPYLVAPDFTSTPATVIAVRPWIAWYSASTGWRWLGTIGAGASSWYRWTATPSGVSQWRTPAGATNPWTWAPIHVPAGRHIFTIAAFEIVYGYAHPQYDWRYALSSSATDGLATYCTYP